MRWRFPVGRISESKNCRRLDCLRHFRRRFLGFSAGLLKAYLFAGQSIASSIRRPFSAWAVSPRRRRYWPDECAAYQPLFMNRTPFPEKRTVDRAGREAVMLGFKECAPFFPKTRTEVTGTPIRTELERLDRADARQKLGLREDLPTLLVMGGSQGASGINQALIKALPFLQGCRSRSFTSPARAMNGWLQTTIAGKISLLTSVRFIIRWRKFTAPPILSSRDRAQPAWRNSPAFRSRDSDSISVRRGRSSNAQCRNLC